MDIISRAKAIIDEEIKALELTKHSINDSIIKAIELIQNTSGKVVLMGVGKSAIIGQKITATMNSLGIEAVFMHGADAAHGDLGVISIHDVVLALSFNGATEEILRNIPFLKARNIPLIAITGNIHSHLAQNSNVVVPVVINKEACKFNLAPTSSTTAMLAVGDVIALVLSELRNFQPQEFALYHPGGTLGRLLLKTVSELMIPLSDQDLLLAEDSLHSVVHQLNIQRKGAVIIVKNKQSKVLEGIITDGDIRSALDKNAAIDNLIAKNIMTQKPTISTPDMLAIDALRIMEERSSQISVLPVIDKDTNIILGIIRIHDILGGKFNI
jgi:arabinose-5-phosphate isomerase